MRTNLATRARVKIFPTRRWIIAIAALFPIANCNAAVALNALGQFLAGHGYGGAQLVHLGNFYRLPINSNGKAGDLTIDTGAPTSLVYRASLGKLGLTATDTKEAVHGAFGKGRERFGRTVIHSITMGNCTLLNMPVIVASDDQGSGLFRNYGASDGLLGLREMVHYGAILDLGNRLLFLRPSGPNKEIGSAVKAILAGQGYTPVEMSLEHSHLRVSGAVNGMSCQFVLDSGAFVTVIDYDAAAKAHIGGARTHYVARGLGGSGREVRVATFPILRVGSYDIKSASAAVMRLDDDVIARGSSTPAAGLLGAEYLAKNSAVLDFNAGVLYLKAKKTR